jgi:hypothetical protein
LKRWKIEFRELRSAVQNLKLDFIMYVPCWRRF